MSIKAVIWDMGGVIVRTEDHASRDNLAAQLGVTRHHLETSVFGGEIGHQAQRGEIDAPNLWEAVRQTYNLSKDGIKDFQKRFWAGDEVDYQLVEYIRSLRKNYISALLSNAWNDLRAVITERWNFADAFDTMIISGEEGVMKPAARIYQIALDRTQVAPSEAVFIDDFAHNIEGAKAVGMHVIQFISVEQTLNDLKELLNEKDH
ncbi:MAG: HAD family phosphatase [Anaerolineales bacterium]|nr:HAD family phosphatase [Chloroflexota bacterium]MBL6980801.1 HAD family phosphatase [Anaerolineales bacterium]